MPRSLRVLALAAALALSSAAGAADRSAVIYKHPQCGCCTGHADYLRDNGYAVRVVETENIDQVKRMAGIPEALASCHTTMIDGYVVEGHVPVGAIDRLLAQKPPVKGISLPGMPLGSPGMDGAKEGPFTVYTIEASPRVFAVE